MHPLPSKSNYEYPEALGFNISKKQLSNAPKFSDVPLIILTASYHGYKNPNKTFTILYNDKLVTMSAGEDQRIWEKLQNNLAKLSNQSVHMYAAYSGHYIQKEQPSIVVDAIYTAMKMSHQ